MSEVVPLPSFGEVFFDARGQERCLRVTWHEGTLVLSLWRGEMCTASFRMPMDDVGRLLDTLDDGFAEATGEQPAVPAQDPGTEVIPGTGTYHRPPQTGQHQPAPDDRPAASLSPNDVLVARGNPAHQDKLVASYGDTREQQRQPFSGPQYSDPLTGPAPAEPFTGPQYTDSGYHDPLSGPHFTQDQQPFTGPQYAEESPTASTGPVYQLPGDRPSPLSTDPLGFPSQASTPYQSDSYQAGSYQNEPYHSGETYRQPDPYPQHQADPYAGRQAPSRPQPPVQAAAGLGTPMHGIPGAGRRQDPFQDRAYGQEPSYGQDPGYGQSGGYGQDPGYGQGGGYGQDRADGRTPPNPVDPLLALGKQAEPYHPQDSDMTRPYVGDPMFSTGERLRPEQQPYDDRGERREW
ncbi:hypothetical protein [Nonomuraea sp. NPDC003214]